VDTEPYNEYELPAKPDYPARETLTISDVTAMENAMRAQGVDVFRIRQSCHPDAGVDLYYLGAGKMAINCHDCESLVTHLHLDLGLGRA
jgi:hypothetical protein